jgi:arabinose-5-phosphate isomerase
MITMQDPKEIAKQVLQLEANSILELEKNLDRSFQDAVDLILKSKGRLLIIGVGKSGHIGKKMAATFTSTGQPSFFIHAAEAVHGDLGMLVDNDICMLISNSGTTKEILAIIPAIKRMGIPIIGLTSNLKSKLAHYADIVLNTYVKKEACPLNLAPTTSTTVTLAYGDALAVTLLTMRGFRKEQFALYHPGGTLGKRLLTKVSDLMIHDNLPLSRASDTFRDALTTMTKGRQGVTIIVDDHKKCVGILTDGDIRRAFMKYDKISDIQLPNIFTPNPKTIGKDALAMEALTKMRNNKITSLVVLDRKENIVGIIHIHHLLEQGFH